MENELFLWPYKNMDFWEIENSENVVEIKWSHNCFEDYRRLAIDFYECGYKTFKEMIDRVMIMLNRICNMKKQSHPFRHLWIN